jgi:methyltransferase (TIGR00027 family)
LTAADTAYAVASMRADERALPEAERLFDDPYAALFAAAGAHAEEGTRRFRELPFVVESTRLRTRFIDDYVREGLASGLSQIVLMGAGFDARARSLPEIAAHRASVFEVDFAASLERKREILAAAGVAIPASDAYVPCNFSAGDFDADLTAALGARGFRTGGGALFVWEGVIGYIGMDAVDRSLAFMARAGGAGSRLVFTFGIYSFDPDGVALHARRAGFASCQEIAFDEIWRRYFAGEPHPHASVVRMGVAVL